MRTREARSELAAWVIIIVWAALYVRKFTDPAFPVPGEVTPVMLAAVAYLFGQGVRARLIRPKETTDEDPS